MAQFKIYGEKHRLRQKRERLSPTIHAAAMETLGLPADKRFHRFIALERDDFIHPPDRGPDYTIIEVSLFEGRSDATKRRLLTTLMRRIVEEVGLAPADIEITLFETPRHHWAIRDELGDALALPYEVERRSLEK